MVLFWAKTKNEEGYAQAVDEARALVERMPGFLGQHVSEAEGGALSVMFWKDKTAMEEWKNHPVHRRRKAEAGKWYEDFQVLRCEVQK